jgi:adenylate cyclase
MVQLTQFEQRTEVPLLVAFIDLTRYTVESRQRSDLETADVLDRYYHRVAAMAESSGGIVVKYIGDAALVVWPEVHTDRGVEAVLTFKHEIDGWFESHGWGSQAHVKLGFGPVVAGPFGPRRSFDVIGSTVNATARLSSPGVALSVAAFRKMGPELRKRFKKHTPPVTYIRTEDKH